MTDDKPLRAQVAEALGCKPVETGGGWDCGCPSDDNGNHPHADPDEPFAPILPYGEDSPEGWACTGPLIARFGIHLGHKPLPYGSPFWLAVGGDIRDPAAEVRGMADPCEAVARCVVALAAAGKPQ